MLRPTRALFPLLLSLPSILTAQAPAERAALRAYSDSLFHTDNLASADGALEPGGTGGEAGQQLRKAFTLLRRGQLSGEREPLDAAQRMFDEAIIDAPHNWPWPWYGLALTDFALDSVGVRVKASVHQGAGVYYRTAALNALAGALHADSSFTLAAVLLSDQLLPYGERKLDGGLQQAVRRATQSNYPAAWLSLGRIYRNDDQPDSALYAFRRYVAAGGDSGVGMLEQAREAYALGFTRAADSIYLAGAGAADSAGRAAYREDMGWIATLDELAAFDSLPDDSVAPFVRVFWTKRDASELRAPGERLAEHLRRWLFVMKVYRVVGRQDGPTFSSSDDINFAGSIQPDPAIGDTVAIEAELTAGAVFAATRTGRRFIDDRGIIYMRHGEPAKVVQEPGDGNTPPNLAWRYETADGPMLFLFRPSLRLGAASTTTLSVLVPADPYIVEGLNAVDHRIGVWSPMRVARMLRENLARGLTSDSYAHRFRHELEPLAQFFAVGQPADRSGQVLTVFALPGDQLTPTALSGGGVIYPVVLHLIATDAAGRVSRLDTTRYFRAADTLGEGEYLSGIETLPLDAGTWDVRLLVTQTDTTVGGAIGRLGLTLAGGDSLALSDLVFGMEHSGVAWSSPAGRVSLAPLDVHARNGTLELYYELSGAIPGRSYSTDLSIEGIAGEAQGKVRLTFTEKAPDPVMRVRRSVALSQLHEGQYRMTVAVTEAGTGRKVSRSRLVNVEEKS